MNFRGHLNGGLLAGAITASVAVTTKYVSLSPEAFQHFTGNPLHWQGEVQTLIGLFLATLNKDGQPLSKAAWGFGKLGSGIFCSPT